MVFSSPIFLFGFLPLVLAFYFAVPQRFKNAVLLCSSLCFYAWGEVFYIGVMVVSIASNYLIGLSIGVTVPATKRKFILGTGVSVNLLLLISFKYANFITDNANALLNVFNVPPLLLPPVHLPLGISFFTFQAVSYIVDVYRNEVEPQRNPADLALYISLFPQLIAGPIVRYGEIAAQLKNRRHSVDACASGIRRFITGLAKKTIIANPMGEAADNIFALAGDDLTMPLAWIGIISYSLQIYFDFSGYSDMAIGLGRMFGFRFSENFNYPYIAESLREFWRRWHISLSTWFRDYLYRPLGGNRISASRTLLNLFIVFLLTGFWHGASWNFIAWGMFHGLFLVLERIGLSTVLDKAWKPVRHFYVLLVVVPAWVLFRADTLPGALEYFHALGNATRWHTGPFQYAQVLPHEFKYILAVGVVFAMPVLSLLKGPLIALCRESEWKHALLITIPRFSLLTAILGLSILKIAASTYNPFIYFRF